MTTESIVKAIRELPANTAKDLMRCRDCADEGPFCPNRGMPCGVSAEGLHALLDERDRLREALTGIRDIPEYDQDDAHRLRNIARRALDPATREQEPK